MSIEFATTIGQGERFSAALAAASDIPVASVGQTALAAQDAAGVLSDRRREFIASGKAIDTAKAAVAAEAAARAIKKKDLPKNIRQPIKDAEEAAEYAQLALDAAAEAFRHAYAKLVAEFNANRPALEVAARKTAEQSVQRMAAARKAFENATVEAHASFGLLGMFADNDRQGRVLLKYRDPKGSRRGFFVSQALGALSEAVGHSNLELEVFKRGTAPTRQELETGQADGEE